MTSDESSDCRKGGRNSDLCESSRRRNHQCGAVRYRMVLGRTTTADLVADVAAEVSRCRSRGIICRIRLYSVRRAHRLYPWFLLDDAASTKLTHDRPFSSTTRARISGCGAGRGLQMFDPKKSADRLIVESGISISRWLSTGLNCC